MTISSTVRKAGPFVGDGNTAVFPFNFKIFQASDLLLTIGIVVTGAESALTLGTDYSVAINADQNANPGGSVTLTSPLPVGKLLVIGSNVPQLQPTLLTNVGGFYPSVLNAVFDRAVVLIQQLSESVGRALKVGVTTVVDAALPTPVPGTVIGWNENGDGFANIPAAGNTQLSLELASQDPNLGSSLVAYGGSTVQAALNSIASRFREWVSVTNPQYKADPTGVEDSTAAIVSAISGNNSIFFPPGVYLVNSVDITSTGAGKNLFFAPGVTIISSSPADNAQPVFYFRGTSSGLNIVGNGVQIKYATAPTARINHVIYVTGTTITDLEISGIRVLNGGNMGIAVYCGDPNATASGSKNICIHDCHIMNTLGDGVHIENADEDVRIYNIYGEGNGDDVVAVINFTGTGGSPIHPNGTENVLIQNIQSKNANTSTISLAGVTNFIVNGVTEIAKPGSSCFTVKMTHSNGYTVGNKFGTLDNITSDGATKVLTLDTPSGGTAYNKYIKIGKIVGLNICNTAISLSNSGSSSDNRLQNIEIGSLELVGSGASSKPAYISNTKNVTINGVHADTFSNEFTVANNDGFCWGKIKLNGFSSTYVMDFVANKNTNAGSLEIDAGGSTNGLRFQSNNGVTHNGMWSVNNASSANYVFGSNINVTGHFLDVSWTDYKTSVGSGSSTTITYPKAAPSGAGYAVNVSVASNEGLRWGMKNVYPDHLNMVWTDTMNMVFTHYNVKAYAA